MLTTVVNDIPHILGACKSDVTFFIVMVSVFYTSYRWNVKQLTKSTQVTTALLKALQRLLREWKKLLDIWRKR